MMNGRGLAVVCAALGAAALVWSAVAADEVPSRRGGRPGGERRAGNMGMMIFGRLIAEEKIAAAFPEKYAALEAAREKYERELAALAQEAKVELPPQRDDALRRIRKDSPAEFSAVVREMETSPRDAMRKLQELAQRSGVALAAFGGRGGRNGRGFSEAGGATAPRRIDVPKLSELRRKYPEQMKEYDSLRREDPQAARNKLLEIMESDRNAKK